MQFSEEMINSIVTRPLKKSKLNEEDTKLKRLKKIIFSKFQNLLILSGRVSGPDYYVDGNPETTWMDYLVYNFRHTFGLMSNQDMKYYETIATIAYGDEVRFDMTNDNQRQVSEIQKIIGIIKSNPGLFEEKIKGKITTFSQLHEMFKDVIAQMDSEMKSSVDNELYNRNQNYDIMSVEDFSQAESIGEYSGVNVNGNFSGKLCYTQSRSIWDSYTRSGLNKPYVCLSKDWKSIPSKKGENYPKDKYGLSMIFFFVDEKGHISNSECRWNHGFHDFENVDNMFTEKEISEIIGVNFYQTFKPYTKEELFSKGIIPFEMVQEMLDNGINPHRIFRSVIKIDNGLLKICLRNKYNIIDSNLKLLSNQWFDSIKRFENGFAVVRLNNKYNFIDTKGSFLSSQWFDDVSDFVYDLSKIMLDDKYNFINKEGVLLSSRWFDWAGRFSEGFCPIEINRKMNFMGIDGKITSDLWFDDENFFKNDFAVVVRNGKSNYIDKNGNLLSDQWFDYADDFEYFGLAKIRMKGLSNLINRQGNIVLNSWFDYISDFEYGMARLRLNGKFNLINNKGELLSEQWFDIIDSHAEEGACAVSVNGKWNYINYNGEIISKQWFDECSFFVNGFAKVRLNYKMNFLSIKGEILSKQWFDIVWNFSEDGFGLVILGEKWNYINRNGEIINKQWVNNYNDAQHLLYDKINESVNKTLFLTEEQAKAISAQEQVNGKVNSGLMCYGLEETKNDNGENVPKKCDKCCGDVVLQIKGEPVYICKKCGKYFGTMPFNLEESRIDEIAPEDVDLSSFIIKKDLNEKFWENGHLDQKIRFRLMEIAQDFCKFAGIDFEETDDIIMTGSLVNYNWDEEYSDVDLHIVYDFSRLDDDTDFVKEYFNDKKKIWNESHQDLKIYGFNVELYVQNSVEEHTSSGIYSINRDEWIVRPNRNEMETSKVNKDYIRKKVSYYTEKIDKIEYILNNYSNDNYRIRKIRELSNILIDKIRNERKKSLESTKKEISNGNIVFKTLRRLGYLDKIHEINNKCYDILNSLP